MNSTKKINTLIIISVMAFMLIISSPYISQRVNNIIKLFLEIGIIMLLILRGKISKKGLLICILPFLFLATTIFSTFRWSGFSTRVLNALITNLAIIIYFYIFYECGKNFKKEKIINLIKKSFLIITIIMDILTIITIGKGLGGLSESVYLFGNKFMLSYFHMVILSFMAYNPKNGLPKIMIYFLYSFIIFRIADTMTGVIGILIIIIIIIITRKNNKILSMLTNPKVFILFFLISNAIFLLSEVLFTNEIISNFLLKYSHTDTLLSGRLPMYKLVISEIKRNCFFGYGINYDIVWSKFGFGNPQNGLLKMLLDYGLLGTSIFIFICYNTFKNLSKSKDKNFIIIITSFIYGMIVCSLVEINLDLIFAIILAMGNSLSISEGMKKNE